MKERYDIVALEKQWLWYVCAALLLALMTSIAFACFYQSFRLMSEHRPQNPNANASVNVRKQ